MISVKGLVFPVAIICIHTSLGKRETGKKKKKNTKKHQKRTRKASKGKSISYFRVLCVRSNMK